tara:strand:- start:7694 stop:8668 length:975 start_codon:yes stop_codon:yes gene_type:complete
MKSLHIISKHILYNIGGAERSTLKYADGLNYNLKILIGFENNKKQIINSKNYKIQIINNVLNINRFYFFEYYYNKRKIKRFLNKEKISHVITYGVYFPLIINSCRSSLKELHIRSETDLGIFLNYNSGFKYVIKYCLKILEWPFEFFYKKELRKAILNSDKVVCNSKFMQNELFKLYGKKSEVVYPSVKINNDGFKSTKEGIVFIGDTKIKGITLVKSIAKEMPEHNFFIFSHKTKIIKRIGNIFYYPWEDNILNVYKRAKLVIVPSMWKEAYGRVARESILLDIPVLVSEIGGLKEAVDFDKSKLIKNYSDKNEWINKIRNII